MKLRYAVLDSPLCPLLAAFGDKGLRRLDFGCARSERAFRRSLSGEPVRVEPSGDGDAAQLAAELARYFAGEADPFQVALDLSDGTAFQRRVWETLRGIPFGETVSYGELAERVGSPRGARAVGRAVGANPVGIVVPCHRVIRADGGLGGFGSGVPVKRWLLRHEGVLE
ncbi:MAG: methylated-DNA--[protein]-cysteine S-methyltransferase [Planctomycetota bacterium]